MANGHGGLRQGSGMKRGQILTKTIAREDAREVLREQLRPYAHEIAQALARRALEGDMAAIREYNDRYYGKVTDRIDYTTNDESIIAMNYILPRELLEKNNIRIGDGVNV